MSALGEAAPDLLGVLAERAGPRAQVVCDFARAYLRRTDHDAVDADEVLGVFAFAESRGRAEVAVRAFNGRAGAVLETNSRDLSFLVDSVSAELAERELTIERVVHPIIAIERDRDGTITGIVSPTEAARRESIMHFELGQPLAPEVLAELEDAVRSVLDRVRVVVDDFPAMEAAVERMSEAARAGATEHGDDAAEEAVAFLRWLRRAHFIFLGSDDGAGERLGLLRDAPTPPVDPVGLMTVTKTDVVSPVHRRARMDLVAVGPMRLLGLFTLRAFTAPAIETPVLDRKLARVVEAEELIEGSHDYKAAIMLLESFPRDELFAWSVDDLRRAVNVLLDVHGERVRVVSRHDAHGASVVVALPAARYTPELRTAIAGRVQRRLDARAVESHEVLADADHVRIHVTAHAGAGALDEDELAREVAALARTWDDALRERLVLRLGEERGRMLAARWARKLPDSYKAYTDPDLGVHDVEGFERLITCGDEIVVGLHDDFDRTRVSLYKRGEKLELSRVMPIFEDLGLHVIEERPTRLQGDGAAWLQSFGVLGPGGGLLDLGAVGERVAACITAVWRGDSESDGLNQLVLEAGLEWPEISILRAYRKYRQRIGSRFTEGYQNEVIVANPHITSKLMRLFALRHDPRVERDVEAEAELREAILADLDDVASLDHDRILRNQLGLIEATVRTNAYAPHRDAIAFKLRSGEVPAIPQPAPLFEIYVYSPAMEGIHLRGGRIARGGIRWSDRQDYRTEVYGLMRAQMVKNAVIVPSGAKGGFYLRGAETTYDAVRAQYVRYVEALLDVTDDLVDGEVVPPAGVRVHDEADTYLVVAADKGTATFSDTANAVAQRRGFWLGDAFASGGSKGYDHKALGITARGAWESLKRHFSELGMDPAVDRFTAVGIGDMSGDVFGNGLLLSDRFALVAAYDHRHVFIDPEPGDTAAGWAERKRLFELPRSSWDDYDRALISEGGGVWSRDAKSIPLSPQARAALGVGDEALPPNEVIQAILRAPVDVLWNGGIGTVVKASTESHDDALDRSSDHIRVDASELRCRVVAEGGNLGLTQRARIEYARGGGRINADFIDNSAGVDCSDHEVNLKILLALAVRRGELDGDGRDALLAEVTEDVAAHVLEDSFLQAQILAQEVRSSGARMDAYEDLMLLLEGSGLLDRGVEHLPGSEAMAERRRTGEGLTQPELAVLLAHAKRHLTDAVLGSELVDEPFLERDLRGYFPPAVVERFGHLIAEHPLRRELTATLEANSVVNCLGPAFAARLITERGAPAEEVVRAFRVAVEVTGARERWETVEQADLDHAVRWELMEAVDWLVEAVARWYLGHPGPDMETAAADGRAGVEQLEAVLPDMGDEEWRAERQERTERLLSLGVPQDLARRHAFQPGLAHAPDMVLVARETGRSVEEVATAFYRVGDGVRLEWLEHRVLALAGDTRTSRWAAQALLEDLLAVRRKLAHRALSDAPKATPRDAVEQFLAAREAPLERYFAFLRTLTRDGAVDLAGLTLAARTLRGLVD